MLTARVYDRPACVSGAAATGRHCHRHKSVVVAAASKATQSRSTSEPVHDGRMSFFKTLEQFVWPKAYAARVLQGHKFAWGKMGLIPSKDTLFIGDLEAARAVMASEMQLGVRGDWPDTMSAMMGHSSVSMTGDLELHARLRQYLGQAFTKEAVQQMLPQLQTTAAAHMARWAGATTTSTASTSSSGSSAGPAPPAGLATTADGSMVVGYPAVRLLTFDVLVNQALGLRMTDAEVQQYAGLFETLVDGFVPPAWDLPFTAYGKGMKARQQIAEHIVQTMRSSQCTGALARLRDEFGPDSPVTVDNTITLLFAGFDTTSSSLSYMLYLLAEHPHVLEKVHDEQLAVVSKHGPTITPEAYRDMPYTMAVVKDTLRLSQIIAYMPRMATQELSVPGGPTLPAGCPFLIAMAAISAADPALQGQDSGFKPERWLDPANAKTMSQYQLPFGTGQRTCIGMNLAYAEMTAVLAELGRTYNLQADTATEWKDFPIKRPGNGLPIRLTPRAGAAAAAAGGARAGEAAAVGV